MSLNKKLLATAIAAGLLVTANANAAVDLDPDTDAVVFASELEDGTLLTTIEDDVVFPVGYNFSPGEVRYGRFECSANLTMDNVAVTSGSGDLAVGAINGEGTSALFFSMTAGGLGADESITLTVEGDNTLEDGGDVSCSFSIYDQPSQAQAGGATGRIATTGMVTVIERESGFVFDATPGEATADVATDYTAFVAGGVFGELQFEEVAGVLKADGTQITLADIFDPDTTVVVAGDFTAATDLEWDGLSADTVDDEAMTFERDTIVPGLNGNLLYVENGTDAIQISSYTATLNAVANAGYQVTSTITVDAGEIVRNGTELQAPLVQLPAGYLSRIMLSNTGSVERPYSIRVIGEDGNVISTNAANMTGTIPANGSRFFETNTFITGFSAGTRATVIITVDAPTDQIQGVYQIVNPANGSISNHVMVRPGTN
ncbi:MAG TPA: hypothetical protein VEY50_11350 [Lysobacter sp.]|nr:hypothetical protein [Lysobacter sp.]